MHIAINVDKRHDLAELLYDTLDSRGGLSRAAELQRLACVEELDTQHRLGVVNEANELGSRRLLACALALLERRIAVTRVRVCDGNAMNVR